MLCKIVLKLLEIFEQRKIYVWAYHVPGKTDIVADYHSRMLLDPGDWRLDPVKFGKIARIWRLKVDLFAAPWNSQLDTFVSWQFHIGCLAVDAFRLSWRWLNAYLPAICHHS